MHTLYYQTEHASETDRNLIMGFGLMWAEFQAAQRSNYADVMNRLVWAGETVPAGQ